LACCGEGLVLRAGIYDVVGVQTADTCGLEDGDLMTPSWYIDYVGDKYGLAHTGNGSTISGSFDGDKIHLEKVEWEEVEECEYEATYTIVLDPFGDHFTGTHRLTYVGCDESICYIEWVLEGLKRKGTETHDRIY
jgi:hypothetical protein